MIEPRVTGIAPGTKRRLRGVWIHSRENLVGADFESGLVYLRLADCGLADPSLQDVCANLIPENWASGPHHTGQDSAECPTVAEVAVRYRRCRFRRSAIAPLSAPPRYGLRGCNWAGPRRQRLGASPRRAPLRRLSHALDSARSLSRYFRLCCAYAYTASPRNSTIRGWYPL